MQKSSQLYGVGSEAKYTPSVGFSRLSVFPRSPAAISAWFRSSTWTKLKCFGPIPALRYTPVFPIAISGGRLVRSPGP